MLFNWPVKLLQPIGCQFVISDVRLQENNKWSYIPAHDVKLFIDSFMLGKIYLLKDFKLFFKRLWNDGGEYSYIIYEYYIFMYIIDYLSSKLLYGAVWFPTNT